MPPVAHAISASAVHLQNSKAWAAHVAAAQTVRQQRGQLRRAAMQQWILTGATSAASAGTTAWQVAVIHSAATAEGSSSMQQLRSAHSSTRGYALRAELDFEQTSGMPICTVLCCCCPRTLPARPELLPPEVWSSTEQGESEKGCVQHGRGALQHDVRQDGMTWAARAAWSAAQTSAAAHRAASALCCGCCYGEAKSSLLGAVVQGGSRWCRVNCCQGCSG